MLSNYEMIEIKQENSINQHKWKLNRESQLYIYIYISVIIIIISKSNKKKS